MLFPVIGSTASVTARDRDLATVTPIGSFASGERTSRTIGFQVVQPILDPTRLFYTAPAARAEARGRTLESSRVRQALATEAGQA